MIKKHLTHISYFVITLLLLSSGLSTAAYTLSDQLSDEPQRILLCTSQGLKWVLVSDLTSTEVGNTDAHTSSALEHCPFCCFTVCSLDNAVDGSTLSASLNPCYNRLHRVDLIHFTLVDIFLFSRFPARAPPVTA